MVSCGVSNSWTRNYKKGLERLHWALTPTCITVHVTKSHRTSLSVFAYCKQSKVVDGEGLGTRPSLKCMSQTSVIHVAWERGHPRSACPRLVSFVWPGNEAIPEIHVSTSVIHVAWE